MPDSTPPPEHRRTVGVYDRPASADWPRFKTIALIAVAVLVIAAISYFIYAR